MNKKVKSNQIHDVNKDVTQIKKNAWKKNSRKRNDTGNRNISFLAFETSSP